MAVFKRTYSALAPTLDVETYKTLLAYRNLAGLREQQEKELLQLLELLSGSGAESDTAPEHSHHRRVRRRTSAPGDRIYVASDTESCSNSSEDADSGERTQGSPADAESVQAAEDQEALAARIRERLTKEIEAKRQAKRQEHQELQARREEMQQQAKEVQQQLEAINASKHKLVLELKQMLTAEDVARRQAMAAVHATASAMPGPADVAATPSATYQQHQHQQQMHYQQHQQRPQTSQASPWAQKAQQAAPWMHHGQAPPPPPPSVQPSPSIGSWQQQQQHAADTSHWYPQPPPPPPLALRRTSSNANTTTQPHAGSTLHQQSSGHWPASTPASNAYGHAPGSMLPSPAAAAAGGPGVRGVVQQKRPRQTVGRQGAPEEGQMAAGHSSQRLWQPPPHLGHDMDDGSPLSDS